MQNVQQECVARSASCYRQISVPAIQRECDIPILHGREEQYVPNGST
ncbi:hypothetical protein AVEN_160594-1, partial [Araneus ventricosus]